VNVTTSGAACFFDLKAEHPEGPWIRGIGSHADVPESDARQGATVLREELPPGTVVVGTNTLPCRVVQTTITDDWGRSAVIAGLTEALTDTDPGVRRRVALGLGQLGVKGLTTQIIALLSQDPAGTYQYIDALGVQGAPEGLPTIIQFAGSTNQFWRKAAVFALRHFNTAEARSALETALNDPCWEVRYDAVQSLAIIGNAGSVKALVTVLHDHDQLVTRTAVAAIAKLGDDSAVEPLLALLSSTNEHVRCETCLHLGEMKLKDMRPVADALLKRLDDPSADVRSMAIVGLGKQREARAVPVLASMTLHPMSSPQGFLSAPPEMMAIMALGQIGNSAAVARLMELLDNPQFAELAFRALAEAGEPAAKPLCDRYVRTRTHVRNDRTLELLGKLGTQETIASLSDYLTHCTPPEKAPTRRAVDQIRTRFSH